MWYVKAYVFISGQGTYEHGDSECGVSPQSLYNPVSTVQDHETATIASKDGNAVTVSEEVRDAYTLRRSHTPVHTSICVLIPVSDTF